jgi:hypothetical protein
MLSAPPRSDLPLMPIIKAEPFAMMMLAAIRAAMPAPRWLMTP